MESLKYPPDALVSLESVLTTAELSRRPSRSSDYQTENQALVALMQELVNSPGSILQKLVDTALELCRAHSAGISLLEEEGGRKIFRWHAIAGEWAPYVWGTTPREYSPCGSVLDYNATLLFSNPHRYYSQFAGVQPLLIEALLVPFHVGGQAVGTVWVVAHDESRRFDAEDQRVLESLGKFAATAYQARLTIAGLDKTNKDLQAEITERERAKKALHESEERYRRLVAVLPTAVYTCAADGVITFYNERAAELWGRCPQTGDSDERFCGSFRLYRPDGTDLPHAETPMAVALATGRSFRNQDVTIEKPDGTRIHVLVSIDVIRDSEGRVIGGINCFSDITDRKQAEQELRRRKEELTAFFENASIGIHWVGADGIIQWANPAELKMLGYSKEEYEGHHIAEFHIDKDGSEDILACLASGEELKDHEARLRCKDGSIRHVLIDSSVLWDEGRFVHAQCFTRDITERKGIEEDLQRLNIELENRVLERTAELFSAVAQRERLQEQLFQAQKLESIGTLAGGIAHDFNNLLNIILGYTLLVQHNAHQGKLSEALDAIKETVQRAASLVQQLLSISKKTEIRFQEIDINEILKKLKGLLSETLPKPIGIDLKLHPNIPPLMADPNQIHQALLNLCVNARDAMPEGGRLLLETSIVDGAELRRNFQEAKEEPYICIHVTDTGTGIDEVTKSRIFEPFFTTKPQGQGTGLGLSVVYGIVTNHSGFVDVESAPDRGTTFRIYLPSSRAQVELTEIEPKLDGKQSEDLPAGHGETVLFVDDEEKQLRLMREFLESEGYRVLIARDGAEAVDVYARHEEEIAAVVLDLGLPKFNGWEAFQRMRKIQPKVNALFATGFSSPEIEAEMQRGRLGGIISKPYQLDEVLEKISATVRKKQLNAGG